MVSTIDFIKLKNLWTQRQLVWNYTFRGAKTKKNEKELYIINLAIWVKDVPEGEKRKEQKVYVKK